MFCSNKRQQIKKVLKGVPIRTFLRAVQEAGYVLGKIESKTAMTPRSSSRSILQAKLAALKMKAHLKDADVDVIPAD